jgi:hypothetical protein
MTDSFGFLGEIDFIYLTNLGWESGEQLIL